jgi:hypothetical protein
MRISFSLLLVFIAVVSFSQAQTGESKRKLQASATFSLNSNGIAAIPAFPLGKPAMMASVSLAKNRFSYDPLLAYGLDFRPWFIDNWFHYKLVVRPAFELRTGFNLSAYFSEYTPPEEFVWHSERYYSFEVAGIYKFSPFSSLSLLYWSDRGQEPESIQGHFLDLVWDRNEMNIGKKVQLNLNVQLYYINYNGDNDGLFLSPKLSSTIRDVPFSLFFQANQALISNITPFPEFKWNLGVSYTL